MSNYQVLHLGQKILKFNVPQKMIDTINKTYEENTLPKHNNYLAGKIEKQHRITEHLTDEVKDYFGQCFSLYLQEHNFLRLPFKVKLLDAWINEMQENEYNPMHTHRGFSYLGLSSVLCLKVPSTYGREYSTEHSACNGLLDIIANNGGMFSNNQYRHRLSVGELFIFPYDISHGVYPFNNTKETRRTMSFNCDLPIELSQRIIT